MIKKLFQTGITLAKVAVRSSFFISMERTTDNHVIVFGNGPSLKDDILNYREIFAKNHLAVVNHFCHSEFFIQMKPKSYFLLDPAFFRNDNPNKIVGDQVQKTMDILNTSVNWNITLYVPYRDRKSKNLQILRKNNYFRIQYVNYVPTKGGLQRVNHWLFNRDLATPQCQNVLVFALFLKVRKESRQIFLFGAENDWHVNVHVNRENQLVIRDLHLYEEKKEMTEKVLLNMTMVDLLESSAKAFNGYWKLEQYARSKNVQIYNCSSNSLIDAFKRLDDTGFKQKLNESTAR